MRNAPEPYCWRPTACGTVFESCSELLIKLHDVIGKAIALATVPAKIELGPVLDLKLGPLTDEVRDKLERFEAWKKKLVSDERILGGEPVFPKSRLPYARWATRSCEGRRGATCGRTTRT
ncbi:MAG: hypothetical protein ABSC94_29355 [Polyangiaceae bacterium]|jgi:hypothetical protein